MQTDVSERIKTIEWRLKRDFNADAYFPDGVPDELKFTLLERAYEEVRVEQTDPEFQEMKELFGEMHTTIDFCGGHCPGCEILEWCQTVGSIYSREDVQWMMEYRTYPPMVPEECA